ncbi:hypothetical protein [Chitinophaga vietnamensis]|uniref:hypothetical protein n=1 Tax=Chitinophaga vietnamensis TaxID=2593957 RepID=UPI001177CEC6|nr:hypothetical protein [Chitinophaga vietnamensis]
MSTQTLFQSLLLLHIIGLLLFAGTTVVDAVIFRQFWKQYDRGRAGAGIVLQAMSPFMLLMRAGIGLIILTGVGMMAMTHGVFGEQLWFRIKFGLVLLLIINALAFGGRQRNRLQKAMAAGDSNTNDMVLLKGRLNTFHIVQLALLFVVILLSVFKFS